jgi:hypothetical protein
MVPTVFWRVVPGEMVDMSGCVGQAVGIRKFQGILLDGIIARNVNRRAEVQKLVTKHGWVDI